MDKFERVKRCPGLYRRQHETADGEKRFKYYARFTCKLKGRRRCEPLGGDLEKAKGTLAQIQADNFDGKDFDAAKEPPKQGMAFKQWAEDYFKNKVDLDRKAGGIERERRSYKPLEAFFGDMLLSDIKRSVLMQYRTLRLQQPITRRGKVVMFNGEPRPPMVACSRGTRDR